ncbi:ATP-binding response regulator, partial [Azohydromonas lata]
APLWAACTAALWVAWAVRPVWFVGPALPRRGSLRNFVLLTALCLLMLGAMAWLPGPRGLLWAVLGLVALAVAAALAPLGAAALLSLLLPGCVALAHWQQGAGGVGDAFTSLGLLLLPCVVLAGWATRRQARWRSRALAWLEREEALQQLAAQRDRAVRADGDKTRFLANASHDLRQPVHALGLFAATLEQRLGGSDHEPYVRNLLRAVDGLDRAFNVLLDVSRLDAGTVQPKAQPVALRDVFQRLYVQFSGRAELAGLNLRFAPGGKWVSSDPQLLERLLANLVQNALKYTERGGVVVVARSAGQHVHVEVWDTGMGMAAAELPRVFDEFYQVGHGGARTRSRGLGMGLSIVKRLAQLLGHGLTVASLPGRGTVFRLSVPRTEPCPAAEVPAPPLVARVPAARMVMVIEDEEAIREALGGLLREWGHEAVVAASAQEAAQAQRALARAPDLIVSDLHLGEGPDGIAAIAAVRRHWGLEVPAVLVTGDTTPPELRRVSESGLEVMVKPVAAGRLRNLLQRLAG